MTEHVRQAGPAGGRPAALTREQGHEFVDFHSRTRTILYRKAARLAAGDRMLSEDLVQETYLRALRRWAQVRQLPPDRQLGWANVALAHVFGDVLRHRARSPRLEPLEEEAAASTDVPTAVLMNLLYQRTLRVAMAELSGRQREVFVLRLLGWDGGEIARMLGISAVTVRWNLSKAWQRLNAIPAIGQTRALLQEEG
jgi:RNA polymerase sigma-70 factor (ECF subfamily)